MNLSPDVEQKLLWTLLAILIPWVLRALVLRAVRKRTDDPRRRYQWRKLSLYLAFAGMTLAAGKIWMSGLETLTTLVGLVGAGIAVALTQPITNLAGWLLIMARRPFEVGDRIQIGEARGDVIDIGVFQFSLMEVGNWVEAEQSTGRIVHLPNAFVFTKDLANYNRDFPYIWAELPVVITFESDWQHAKRILAEIAKKVAADDPERAAELMAKKKSRYMLHQGKLTPIVYTSVRENGVALTIRILVRPHQRRGLEERIWEEVLLALSQTQDIEFAYPTQRFFRRGEARASHQTVAGD